MLFDGCSYSRCRSKKDLGSEIRQIYIFVVVCDAPCIQRCIIARFLLALEDGLALLGKRTQALEAVLGLEEGVVRCALVTDTLLDRCSGCGLDGLLGGTEREGGWR